MATELATIPALAPKAYFDFEANRVEEMDFATLRRSHRANDHYGQPLRGIHHFQVIDRLAESCTKHGLSHHIEEIFAAQNKSRTEPGVILLPNAEREFGPKAVEAHILNRVFTTIRIDNHSTEELTTTLAVAYHQEGIQVAIGPCVRICHNQCILSAENRVSTYGKGKVSLDQLFNTVDGWLGDFDIRAGQDIARIERLKSTPVSPQFIYQFIGLLTTIRVMHDSSDKRLSDQVGTYPLNQSQITVFTENLLKLKQDRGDAPLTAWDVYNVGTELYKPGKMEFSTIIPQNAALADTLFAFISGGQA